MATDIIKRNIELMRKESSLVYRVWHLEAGGLFGGCFPRRVRAVRGGWPIGRSDCPAVERVSAASVGPAAKEPLSSLKRD